MEYGGIPNKKYNSIWHSIIPLKIKVFLLILRKHKLLTIMNLAKRRWQGDTSCLFCGQPETTSHLFIQCSYVKQIWDWIAQFNGLSFNCQAVEDLWLVDVSLPFKNRLLVEVIRGAVLWTILLERNPSMFFKGTNAKTLGSKIISLTSFWVSNKNSSGSNLSLSIILSFDVKDLPDPLQDPIVDNPDLHQAVKILMAMAEVEEYMHDFLEITQEH